MKNKQDLVESQGLKFNENIPVIGVILDLLDQNDLVLLGDIIDDILERNKKWDVYGISMIYLQIFGCISRVFSLKGTFMSKITLELSKNLDPDSD